MAARVIGMDELKSAVQEYASRHDLTMSSNEKGFCLMPGDTVITLLREAIVLQCGDPG